MCQSGHAAVQVKTKRRLSGMNHDQLTLEDGEHTYSRGAQLLSLAANGFGVEVSSDQFDEWQAMFGSIYKLDSILDSDLGAIDRENRYDILVSDLIDSSAEGEACLPGCQLCRLKNQISSWGVPRVDELGKNLEEIKKLTLMRRETSNAVTLGKLVLLEGALAADLLAIPAEPKFNNWLRLLGASGTIIDTVVDLEEDYDRKLTRVTPGITNKLKLAIFV